MTNPTARIIGAKLADLERRVKCVQLIGPRRVWNVFPIRPCRSIRRTLSGPECLAAIRRIAMNFVRLMDDEHSLKGRMEIAAMNDEYLLRLIVNAIGKF